MASRAPSQPHRRGGRFRRSEEGLAALEHRYTTLVHNSSDLIAVLNAKAELLYANPVAERMLGRLPKEHTGRSMLEFLHPDDREAVTRAFFEEVLRPGVRDPAVFRFQAASGEWRVLEVVATNCLDDPAIAGIVINARDVTEREHLTRALRTLGESSQILVNATDEASLLTDTCRSIVDAGGYPLAWIGYVERDEARTVRPVAWSGQTEYLEQIGANWVMDEPGLGPIRVAIHARSMQGTDDDGRTREPEVEPEDPARFGLRSSCVLPLEVDGRAVGVLAVYAAEAGAFDPPEVALFGKLGNALAYGIGRIRNADSLSASEDRFRTLADSAPIGILEVSSGTTVVYANTRIAEISGRDVGELMGSNWIDAVHPDDASRLLALIDTFSPDRERADTTFRIQRPGGEVRHVRMRVAPKGRWRDGYVVTVSDITEEVQVHEALAHQALFDSLTGLPNRVLFLDRLEQELARGRRNGPSTAVLFLDLDRFKIVNDSLGHEAGDAVLKEVGDRFMRAVRAGETTARFSGDKFTFIIRDVHQPDDAVTAVRRLLALLESPIRCAGQVLTVTASIGIVFPDADADSAAVLRDAETAMYQAKEAGRNTYTIFNEDLHRRSVTRLTTESELHQALERCEFEVYYQPAIDLASGRPFSAEALIRWRHPARGLVPSPEFIPVAEDSGLIMPIGRWVFEQAISQLAAWDAADDGPGLHVLAVNLSPRQLFDPHTSGMVREALQRIGIAPRRVCVEITESVMMGDGTAVRESLEDLRALGLRVAMDDFGTGYSSLAFLHTLPVTTLKIDRSFVERLGAEDDSTPVVKAIIDMGHAMGLRVVAEGVSSEAMSRSVSALGCDLAQGFYWAPPMPADEFAEWWREAERFAVTLPRVS